MLLFKGAGKSGAGDKLIEFILFIIIIYPEEQSFL
jgi:hypothetical protein